MEPHEIIALHWICECGESAEDVEENALHVVNELAKAGYFIPAQDIRQAIRQLYLFLEDDNRDRVNLAIVLLELDPAEADQ